MSLEIKAKIDCKKIIKKHLYEGKEATYLDVAFFKNKDGKGKYGDDGFVVQEVSKEARERGEKGQIIGNWRYHEPRAGQTEKPKSAETKPGDDPDADLPF
jgi:hypothetical protein